MCAIVDYANVGNVAVGSSATGAAKEFLRYVSRGGLKIVLGGSKLSNEISSCSKEFQQWLFRAIRAGCVSRASDDDIDELTKQLEDAGGCNSDDEHLIALATVTRARLIFTNDRALQRDCKNLLDPPAHIYTTNDQRTAFSVQKRKLLETATCNPAH